MTRIARHKMRPGQMFVVNDPLWPTDRRDVMVVLNDKVEIGFWHGGSWCWGYVAPSVAFEVIS